MLENIPKSVLRTCDDLGYKRSKDGLLELLKDCEEEGGVAYPTTCEDHCFVEPDGECSHGKPSILLLVGIL